MKVSKVALAAATMLGGSAMLIATPAFAQYGSPQTQTPNSQQIQQQPAQQGAHGQPAQRQLNLSRAERTALAPLDAALRAQNWAAAQAALPAARAAVRTDDGRYFVANAAFQIAFGTRNAQAEAEALTALLALRNIPANEQAIFLARQGELAFQAGDIAGAQRAFERVLQLTPNDTRVQNNLAIVRRRLAGNAAVAENPLQTIARQEAAGERVAEATYTRAIRAAYQARQREQTLDLLRKLVIAYPTTSHWHDAVSIYREYAGTDIPAQLDAMRMLRAARALNGRDDYLPFATALDQSGLPGETKAVIDEGIAAGALQAGSAEVTRMLSVANRRIAEDRAGLAGQMAQARNAANGRPARIVADALYGYGRYTEAAEMYRLALSKGGEDANLVNTRLGATLALAGQRAQAEAALRAVTGPRAGLAGFWLAWLAGRPA